MDNGDVEGIAELLECFPTVKCKYDPSSKSGEAARVKRGEMSVEDSHAEYMGDKRVYIMVMELVEWNTLAKYLLIASNLRGFKVFRFFR